MKNILNIKQQTTLGLLGLFSLSSLFNPLTAQKAEATNNNLEEVTVELVLAVDVSASVDSNEFNLQIEGYKSAFEDAEVLAEIKKLDQGLAVNMVFWADKQPIDIGWFKLEQDANGNITNLNSFTNAIDSVSRNNHQITVDGNTTNVGRGTDIQLAIATSQSMLLNNQYDGKSLVMDVSGDGVSDDTPYNGVNNIDGECGHQHFCPPVTAARDAAIAEGITINGLPINNESSSYLADEVDTHYEQLVYGGEGAFIELSAGFDDFARAAKEKIKREIKDGGERAKSAVQDTFVTKEDESFSDNVLTNDRDPDGIGLAVAKVNGEDLVGSEIALPSGALVTINANGSLVYNPNGKFDALLQGQSQVDTFEYSISDGVGGYSSAAVSMTIEGVGMIYPD